MTAADLYTAASFVLTALANGIWESALLAGLALLVFRVTRGANATTRHAVLVTALIGSFALPVFTTAIAFMRAPAPARVAVSETARGRVVAPSHSTPVSLPRGTHGEARAAQPSPLGSQPQSARILVPWQAIVSLVALWLAGVAFFSVRLVISLLYLERLKRDALPLPVEPRTRLERWAAATGYTHGVRLCRSSEIAVPIAVGLFDGMILIPENLLEELSSEDLDRIVLHEFAHLRRGDDWINALERVAEALFFFNPAIRWMIRQLDLEREVACDDWVLERRHDALPYAQCLVKLVESIAWPHRPMAAPGVFITRRAISVRIERLLAAHRDVRIRVSPGPLATATLVTLAACALCVYVAPSIAYGGATEARSASTHGTAVASRLASRVRNHTRSQPTGEPSFGPTPAPTYVSAATPPRATQTAAAVAVRTHVTTHAETQKHTAHVIQGAGAASSDGSGDGADHTGVLSASQKVGGDYISELEGAGYSNLSLDDLIKLKSLGVSGDYIRAMAAAGFGHPPVEQLVKLRALGVTPEYVRDIRKLFPSASLDEIVQMRAVGVTPDYVSGLQSAGLTGLTADSVRGLRALGVDATYMHEMSTAGYPHLNTEQLEKLRALGIDRDFVKRVEAHGFHNLDIEELVRLKATGVIE
jgi:beta-lactamase regulating signal transducer with metallopeptidase domain